MKKKIAEVLLIVCIAGFMVLTGQNKVYSDDKVLKDLPTSWDLTRIYENDEVFEADLKRVDELVPEIEKLRGTLDTTEGLLNLYESPAVLEVDSILKRMNIYRINLSSLDASDPRAIKAVAGFKDAYMKTKLAYAFEVPEIMEIPLDKRIELFSDERLKPYAYYSRNYLEPDRVVLSEDAEKVRTLMRAACNNDMTRNIFDNTELPLPDFTYPDGTKGILTEKVYDEILKSRKYDKKFRKKIDELHNATRQPYAATYASLLDGLMRRNWADAQIDGFDSTLEAALHDTNVDPKVYDRIISFAHDMQPKCHEYFKARKKMLGVDQMMYSDLFLPAGDYEQKEISYEEAVNEGRKAISVWGDEYLDVFDRIVTAPQIDVYPSEKKDTGDFTEYQGNVTMPFISFNYDGTESYIDYIVHEMGHAVHLEFSGEYQNVYNSGAEIFTAEVASQANELMLFKYKFAQAKTEEEKLYWLDEEIKTLFKALFRQCMFSEFEDYCYKTIEKGDSLEAGDMADKWLELCREYYGEDVSVSDDFGIDWTTVSHFYSRYYVYQYATSMTYAAAVSQKVEDALSPEEKQKVTEAYLDFLKSGKSADPVSLLKLAGVDPLDDKTYEEAGEYFSRLVDEYIKAAGQTI